MAEKLKDLEKVSTENPKALFKEMIIYLVDHVGIKMTTIERKTGIDYNKISNTRKGGSSGNKELMDKMVNGFPELIEVFNLNTKNNVVANKKPDELINFEDTEALRKEVERLKAENLAIYKKLVAAQEQLLKQKQ